MDDVSPANPEPGGAAGACPVCGEIGSIPDARYCENCGRALYLGSPEAVDLRNHPDTDEETAYQAGDGTWQSSTVAVRSCSRCKSGAVGAEGYCDHCGQRSPCGSDRAVLVLDAVSGVTDRGLRKERNEDAMAIGQRPGAALAVVCDGVSSSVRADAAARAAVDTAMPALLAALAGGENAPVATDTAARAAQAAVAATASSPTEINPPSSTYLSAIVTGESITVGWIGDSRAYWLPAHGGQPACLTADDSLAGQLIAAGTPAEVAVADPRAAALVRWLGADAEDGPPHQVTFDPLGPGRLLLCSDGLSRYRPGAAELAADTPPGTPAAAAESLVRLARDAGGADNITVVLLPYPPAEVPVPGQDGGDG